MSEKVKYFSAFRRNSYPCRQKISKRHIFLAASPLKSIKVSGAAGTKEKKPSFFSLKNFFLPKKRSGLLQADYLTFAGNYGIYSTNLYKSPGLARKRKERTIEFLLSFSRKEVFYFAIKAFLNLTCLPYLPSQLP